MFDYFQRTQDRILQFIIDHSHIDRETLLKLMLETGELTGDIGSVIYGKEAVKAGLIDHVGGLREALECLHEQIDKGKQDKEA